MNRVYKFDNRKKNDFNELQHSAVSKLINQSNTKVPWLLGVSIFCMALYFWYYAIAMNVIFTYGSFTASDVPWYSPSSTKQDRYSFYYFLYFTDTMRLFTIYCAAFSTINLFFSSDPILPMYGSILVISMIREVIAAFIRSIYLWLCWDYNFCRSSDPTVPNANFIQECVICYLFVITFFFYVFYFQDLYNAQRNINDTIRDKNNVPLSQLSQGDLEIYDEETPTVQSFTITPVVTRRTTLKELYKGVEKHFFIINVLNGIWVIVYWAAQIVPLNYVFTFSHLQPSDVPYYEATDSSSDRYRFFYWVFYTDVLRSLIPLLILYMVQLTLWDRHKSMYFFMAANAFLGFREAVVLLLRLIFTWKCYSNPFCRSSNPTEPNYTYILDIIYNFIFLLLFIFVGIEMVYLQTYKICISKKLKVIKTQ